MMARLYQTCRLLLIQSKIPYLNDKDWYQIGAMKYYLLFGIMTGEGRYVWLVQIKNLFLLTLYIKRRDIFLKCREMYDISILVDTHSTKEFEHIWQSEWGFTAIQSTFVISTSVISNNRLSRRENLIRFNIEI